MEKAFKEVAEATMREKSTALDATVERTRDIERINSTTWDSRMLKTLARGSYSNHEGFGSAKGGWQLCLL